MEQRKEGRKEGNADTKKEQQRHGRPEREREERILHLPSQGLWVGQFLGPTITTKATLGVSWMLAILPPFKYSSVPFLLTPKLASRFWSRLGSGWVDLPT